MTYDRNRWQPQGTHSTGYEPPKAGDLIARAHAVWRVDEVVYTELTDAERQRWIDRGMPDMEKWAGRPYKVDVTWIGGARPDWSRDDETAMKASLDVPATDYGRYAEWDIYPPSGRWPMCSCCGEPMPCRAEMQDREVYAGMTKLAILSTKLPGHCWACDEPFSHRQKSVVYGGDNLDLPGGPEVKFHLRAKCRGRAEQYELRWIAEDPRRERVLTYPSCPGILYVHADGTSECASGRMPLTGETVEPAPDCRGHLTHDHSFEAACYVGDRFLAREQDFPGCARGCDPHKHRGTATTARPDRRDTSQLTL